MDRPPGQQRGRVPGSSGSSAVRCKSEGSQTPCLLRLPSSGSPDDGPLPLPECAPLLTQLGLPQAGTIARFLNLTNPQIQQPRPQPLCQQRIATHIIPQATNSPT